MTPAAGVILDCRLLVFPGKFRLKKSLFIMFAIDTYPGYYYL